MLCISSSAQGQVDGSLIKDVIVITDKQELPKRWLSILEKVGTKDFSRAVENEPTLVFKKDNSLGYLFDIEAPGIDKRFALSKVSESILDTLARGDSLNNVKLSSLPADLAKNIRKRFLFHNAVGLKGIESADFNVTVSTGLTLYFERDGKSVKMIHRFPYSRPDPAVTLTQRESPLKNLPTDAGALVRPLISEYLVVHFSNPLRSSQELMGNAASAFLASSKYIAEITEANDVLVDKLWSEMLKQQEGIDADINRMSTFQELPDRVQKFLIANIASSYESMGFSSSDEATEYLRFASIRHADRLLRFSVGYLVEGLGSPSQLTMNFVLDHR